MKSKFSYLVILTLTLIVLVAHQMALASDTQKPAYMSDVDWAAIRAIQETDAKAPPARRANGGSEGIRKFQGFANYAPMTVDHVTTLKEINQDSSLHIEIPSMPPASVTSHPSSSSLGISSTLAAAPLSTPSTVAPAAPVARGFDPSLLVVSEIPVAVNDYKEAPPMEAPKPHVPEDLVDAVEVSDEDQARRLEMDLDKFLSIKKAATAEGLDVEPYIRAEKEAAKLQVDLKEYLKAKKVADDFGIGVREYLKICKEAETHSVDVTEYLETRRDAISSGFEPVAIKDFPELQKEAEKYECSSGICKPSVYQALLTMTTMEGSSMSDLLTANGYRVRCNPSSGSGIGSQEEKSAPGEGKSDLATEAKKYGADIELYSEALAFAPSLGVDVQSYLQARAIAESSGVSIELILDTKKEEANQGLNEIEKYIPGRQLFGTGAFNFPRKRTTSSSHSPLIGRSWGEFGDGLLDVDLEQRLSDSPPSGGPLTVQAQRDDSLDLYTDGIIDLDGNKGSENRSPDDPN